MHNKASTALLTADNFSPGKEEALSGHFVRKVYFMLFSKSCGSDECTASVEKKKKKTWKVYVLLIWEIQQCPCFPSLSVKQS